MNRIRLLSYLLLTSSLLQVSIFDRCSAQTHVLQGLAFAYGEDRMAVAEEGDGGFFVAGFVVSGTEYAVQVVHVRPYLLFPWGTSGLTAMHFNGFFVQGDLAVVPDGEGGVYVAAAARDLSFVPRLVIGHFSASQQYTQLYSSSSPNLNQPFEVEAVTDGQGGIVVVGALDPPAGRFFSVRAHHAPAGASNPLIWSATQHDDEFAIAGDGYGGVLLVHGAEYEVRAQRLAADDTFPWGSGGLPINNQTGSPVLDRRCVYDPATGDFRVVWTEQDGECFGEYVGYDGSSAWYPGGGLKLLSANVTESVPTLGLDVEVVGDGSILVVYGQAELQCQRISEDGEPVWDEPNIWIPGDPAPGSSIWTDLTLLEGSQMFDWCVRLGTDPQRVATGFWGRLADGGISAAANYWQQEGEPAFEQPRRIYDGVYNSDTFMVIRTAAPFPYVELFAGPPSPNWITPNQAEQGSSLQIEVSGSRLHPTHEFFLERAGEPAIPLTSTAVIANPGYGAVLRADVDLSGAALGMWDLVVRSPLDGAVLAVRTEAFEVTSAVTAATPAPAAPASLVAFPNPANPLTTLRFDSSRSDVVTLTIYDVAGRRVRRLLDAAAIDAGQHVIEWRGDDDGGRRVSSGVYLARLDSSAGAPRTTRISLVQ